MIMRYSTLKIHTFILLITVGILFIGITPFGISQKRTSTLSGRVVNTKGNPVKNVPIYIGPIEVIGNLQKRVRLPLNYYDIQHTQTDFEGHFTITDIPSESVFIGSLPYNLKSILPEGITAEIIEANQDKNLTEQYVNAFKGLIRHGFEPDFKVLSLHYQDVTLYPYNDSQEIVFAVKPATHIQDVVVTVRPRMRIRGRLLYKDGMPVSNVRLSITTKLQHQDGRNSSFNSYASPKTDVEGYFVIYPEEINAAATYIFSVKYRGLVVNTRPFQLNPGERLDGLTLTLDSDPIAPKTRSRPPATKNKKVDPPPMPKQQLKPISNEVWIVNPTNRHAYKRVHCKSREDAIAQATKEKAHLVTINDAKEQEWIEKVFGYTFYWIGLNDAKKEGKWQWHNGEPITYENWLPNDYISESFENDERDYVVLTFIEGKWYAVSPKSVIADMTKMAIIEKEDVKIISP